MHSCSPLIVVAEVVPDAKQENKTKFKIINSPLTISCKHKVLSACLFNPETTSPDGPYAATG